MPRRPIRISLALALAGSALGLSAAHAQTASVDSGSVTLRTTNDAGACASTPQAQQQNGVPCPTFELYYAAPATGHPKALVVFFHGHGHNGEQYVAQLAALAARDDVVAVAMATQELAVGQPSYRGPFDSVDEEARDAASAIDWARQRYQTGTRTYLFGTSMGGSGLAYFLDAATRPAGGDADATWVQRVQPLPLAGLVDVEGIADLAETWAEATAVEQPNPVDAKEIETETGGTPVTAPSAYRARSIALLTPAQLQASGLPVAAVIHDVDDGLVPYNQTQEARLAFRAAGIAVQSYDVVFKDFCTQGNQTTATSYAPIPGAEQQICLAGHANENDSTTPVMRTAFRALDTMLAGNTATSSALVNTSRPSS